MSDDRVAIARLETRVDNNEKKLEKLEANNELLYRLAVVSEAQQISNDKQSLQLEEMSKTFQNINDNLTNLNNSQDILQQSMDRIGARVDIIESDLEEEKERDNISISEIAKKWAKFIMFGIPSAIIMSYLMIKFGFN